MVKTDLGEKQMCPNCGAKFYDLCRRPATCPKCTASFDPAEESVRSRRSRARVAAHGGYEEEDEEVPAKPARTGEEEDEEAEATPEVDVEAEAEPLVGEEEDDAAPAGAGDEIPEGFSEEEADLGEDAGDDDSVPLLEDEEEFPEDEIGDLPGEEDDDSGR